MSVATPEMGIDVSRTMDDGDRAATEAFYADMQAEFAAAFKATESKVGQLTSVTLPAYVDALDPYAAGARDARIALNTGILPW